MKREDKTLCISLKTDDGQEIDVWHYHSDGAHGRERAQKWADEIVRAANLRAELDRIGTLSEDAVDAELKQELEGRWF